MDLIGNLLLGFAVSGVTATTFYTLWCYAAGGHGVRISSAPASMLRLGIERVMSRWPASQQHRLSYRSDLPSHRHNAAHHP